MSSEPALVISGLSKIYKVYRHPVDRVAELLTFGRVFHTNFAAVSNVSFNVGQGETVGILGANGSGKSTLLQMLAGTTTPTSGEIRVRGRLAALLQLGTGFIPEVSGRKNAVLSLRILGLDDEHAEARLEWIEKFAGLEGHFDKPIKFYSSGMYARLAFTVAASVRPDIILVDEALSVGDLVFQKKAEEFMTKDMAGSTKIIVNHDMGSIARHCDRVVVLDAGCVVFDGPVMEGISVFKASRRRSDALSDFEVVAESSGVVRKVSPGEEVRIAMDLTNRTSSDVDCSCGLGWKDGTGRPVFGGDDLMRVVMKAGCTTTVETIVRWPEVGSGFYQMDAWIDRNGLRLSTREECSIFQVEGISRPSEFPLKVAIV